MISLDSLPLSSGLKLRLRAWSDRFDELMNTDYQWPSGAEEAAWDNEGRGLLGCLRDELGAGYDIGYFTDSV